MAASSQFEQLKLQVLQSMQASIHGLEFGVFLHFSQGGVQELSLQCYRPLTELGAAILEVIASWRSSFLR